MHHLPSGPPLSARLTGALSRWAASLRRALRLRGRVAPVVLLCGVVAGIALTMPVVKPVAVRTDGGTPVDLGSSGSAPAPGPGPAPGDADRTGDERAGRSQRPGVAQPGPDGEPSAPGTAAGTTGAAPEGPAPASTRSARGTQPPSESTSAPSSASAPSSGSPSGSTSGSPSAPAATEKTSASAPESGGPAPVPAVPAPAAPGTEAQVLALANQERAAAGCRALVADEGLAALARAHSADMRDRDFFGHDNPDGLSPFERGDRAGVTVLAENIAVGQPDAAAVMAEWMSSPGHRTNILDCSYSRLGVGVAQGLGGPWWTQDFA